jgi:hypothetical protein
MKAILCSGEPAVWYPLQRMSIRAGGALDKGTAVPGRQYRLRDVRRRSLLKCYSSWMAQAIVRSR